MSTVQIISDEVVCSKNYTSTQDEDKERQKLLDAVEKKGSRVETF